MTIEVLERASRNVVGFRVEGRLTEDDLKSMTADLERRIAEVGALRLLCEMDEFSGIEIAAVWQDLKFSLKHLRDIERMAIVGDRKWEEWYARLSDPLFKTEIRHFSNADVVLAWAWLEG